MATLDLAQPRLADIDTAAGTDPFAVSVADYASRSLIAVPPDASLDHVLRTLDEGKISCVAVVSEGKAIGVVSTTDLARVARHDPGIIGRPTRLPLGPKARDVMHGPLLAIGERETVRKACDLMLRHRVHRVFVRRGGVVVGVLSARDVMRAVLAARVVTPLGRFMAAPVRTLDLGDSIERALELLDRSDVRGLVIVDGKFPVGVFTQTEAIWARALPQQLWRLPVEEVMSFETLCLDEATPLYRVAGHVAAMQVRRILATRDGELVGIVTGYDLVRAATTRPPPAEARTVAESATRSRG